MPSTQPTVAIANSAKKKIRPRSDGPSMSRTITGWPASQSGALGVGVLVRVLAVAQVQEDAIVAVRLGRPDGLVDDRHDALAVLARRLGDELLDPEPERLQRRVDHVGQLVAARERQLAPGDAEP